MQFTSWMNKDDWSKQICEMHQIEPKLNITNILNNNFVSLGNDLENLEFPTFASRQTLRTNIAMQILSVCFELTEDLAATCFSYAKAIKAGDKNVPEYLRDFGSERAKKNPEEVGNASLFYKTASESICYTAEMVGLDPINDVVNVAAYQNFFRVVRDFRKRYDDWYQGYKHGQRTEAMYMWAVTGQKLPLLKQNIKLGNSLSDDEKVAGDRAFNWNEQFETIMKEGGFDVVIGNPPYLDSEEMVRSQPELRVAYANTFASAKGNWDIFCIFLEKGMDLLKEGGYLGMIVPNKLLSADYATEIRNLIEKYRVIIIRDYSSIPVFQASVYPVVIIVQKGSPKNNKLIAETMEAYSSGVRVQNHREISQKDLHSVQNSWAHIFGESGEKIRDKILRHSNLLADIADASGAASVSESYAMKPKIAELANQNNYFKMINTGTIDRYSSLWGVFKMTYIKSTYEKPVMTKDDLNAFSRNRYEQALATKIIIGGMNKRLEAYLDNGKFLAGKSTGIILPKKINPKVLLAIINSKLITFYYKDSFKSLSLAGGFLRIGLPQIKKLPIRPVSTQEEQELIALVDKMTSLNERLNEIYFKKTDEHANIEEKISKTDSEIDELVYKIYGITDEEKKTIEKVVPD